MGLRFVPPERPPLIYFVCPLSLLRPVLPHSPYKAATCALISASQALQPTPVAFRGRLLPQDAFNL